MSTRSATIIYQEREKFRETEGGWYEFDGMKDVEIARFYRHCDGYPDGHGLHMAYSFLKCDRESYDGRNWFQVLLGGFMCGLGLYDTPFANWGAPRIEFEEVGYEHGDIEYLYTIKGDRKGEVEMAVYKIGWDERYDDALAHEPMFRGTPAEYIAWQVKEG